MEIKIIRSVQELSGLEPEWQRLWLEQGRGLVFQHHAWALAFVEAFCATRPWMVLAAYQDDRIAALLPIWQGSNEGTWTLIGSPNADYQHFLGSPEAIVETLERLPSCGVKTLHLENMPEGPRIWQWLRDHQLGIEEDGQPAFCRRMALTEQTVRGVLKRGGMKDNERRLSKIGPLRLKVLKTPDDQLAMLETLFSQHQQRWDGTHTPSQFHDPRARDFYRRLCQSPTLVPLLHFSVLEAGEKNLACHFGFVATDTLLYYKPTHNPEFKGGGRVLMGRLMEEALRMGLKEFDFTRGDEPYKAEIATGGVLNHDARLFFSQPARLQFKAWKWLVRRVPRDANGLAIPTKVMRKLKRLTSGR